MANHSRPRLRSRSRTHCSRSRIAAYYRPITLDLGLNRGRERIVRDRERIVYVWKFIEKMDFDLGKIIFIFRRSSFLLKCNLAAAENCIHWQWLNTQTAKSTYVNSTTLRRHVVFRGSAMLDTAPPHPPYNGHTKERTSMESLGEWLLIGNYNFKFLHLKYIPP